MRQKVFFEDLGIRSYQPSWDYQEELLLKNTKIKWAARQNEQDVKTTNTEHRLLMVEHNPVFTLGKSGKREHVLVSEEQLKNLGIEFFHINRGGDVTYHGLQQIVGYPILDLDKFKTDLGWYLRSLEQVIIDLLAEYGLKGERSAGETGVWLEPNDPFMARKICAMGVRCSRWITMHGIALYVNTDLGYFKNIVPCGIDDKDVTSIAREVGYEVDFNQVSEILKKEIAKQFEMELL
jgi:lipoyl(octanoyl) transferase